MNIQKNVIAVRTHFVGVERTRESIDLSCWGMQRTETTDSLW